MINAGREEKDMMQRTPVFRNLNATREYWKGRAIDAEKRIDELLSIIDTYGSHKRDCLIWIEPQYGNCDCGFDTALAKTQEVQS